jgi:hypothetical protein
VGRPRQDERNVGGQRPGKFRQKSRGTAHQEVGSLAAAVGPEAGNGLERPPRHGPCGLARRVGVVVAFGGGYVAWVRVDALQRVGVGAALCQAAGEQDLGSIL